MKLIDTHCHLNDVAFADDITDVIKRAHQHGVEQMIVVGVDKKTGLHALELAEKYAGLSVAIAWHPVDVIDCTADDQRFLETVWQHEKVVAIGETGLDYHWKTSPPALQQEFFKWHLEAAVKYQLPIIIHNRDAHEDTLAILQAFVQKHGPVKGVMHSYSGSVELAKSFLKLGLHISISGVVTFKNAKNVQEVVPFIPDDRLLVETDAPYLTPVPFRGKRNEPAYTYYTAEAVARLRGRSLEEVALLTTNNAQKLFNLRAQNK